MPKAKNLKVLRSKVISNTGSCSTSPAPVHDPVEDSGTHNSPTDPIDLEDDADAGDNALKGRTRSLAWNHFTPYFVEEEVMVDGVPTKRKRKRALCNHCKKADYSADPHSGGTSQMNKHFKYLCPVLRLEGQTLIASDNTAKNKLVIRGFNQKDVMVALIEMIVVDEMPFSTVEKMGFRKFCSIAIPEFRIPSRRLFVREFLIMYTTEKNRLKKELSRHRVSLTTDCWTSVQNMSYMVLTAHFIDSEWKMHKRIIGFRQIPNHQGITIGKLIESCLLEWGIEKILAITVDNASANKSALEWLRSRMNNCWENSKVILGGQFLHVRCIAHIVNLIVGDGLKVLNNSVLAIRNSVAFVRSSTHRLLTFKNAVEAEKIPCKGLVILDVSTRWNSTYLMLRASLIFRKAFDKLSEEDSSYMNYFSEPLEPEDDPNDMNDHLVENALGMDNVSVGVIAPRRVRKRVGPPVDFDWQKAEAFVNFLELFYKITLRVSSSLKPTIHGAFHDILSIEKQLSLMTIPSTNQESEEMQTRSELDKVLSSMCTKMSSKYRKYFGNSRDLNELIFIGLVLDPRFKIKYVENVFESEGFTDKEVKHKIGHLTSLLRKLHDCYKPSELVQCSSSQSSEPSSCISRASNSSNNYSKLAVLSAWTKKGGNTRLAPKHEVDKYLNEEVEDYFEDVEFDILAWWKVNCPKYPVLAVVAKDVLAVQVSTVASESAFSTGGRIIDSKRSSLTPKSAEALICLQNWLRGDDIITNTDDEEHSIQMVEFYESCESDASTTSSAASVC